MMKLSQNMNNEFTTYLFVNGYKIKYEFMLCNFGLNGECMTFRKLNKIELISKDRWHWCHTLKFK